MITSARRSLRRAGPIWGALLAALLCLRAVAPEFALSAPEGYVPICKDGRIVWLALDGGAPKSPGGDHPCPVFGLGAAISAAAPALAPPAPPRAALRPALRLAGAAEAAPLSYRARAPPHRV